MPIVNRLKKLFVLGSGNDGQKSGSGPGAKTIPDIVRLETDVREYWILDEVIGDGAFGNVFKAHSKEDPERVAAAKAMELEDDESQDVMVEVSILTQCKHPNIVELYDAFTMGNRITLLLEYCGGGAVDSIMMELSRNLSEQQIHYIMKEILKALDFLHSKNVIHRDLKAGNVLLTSDAKVKLADFGVSALCKDAREVRSTFIGTPYWMAPEVMICETFPEKHYNKLADIWSFGITLIEMAEEKPPYAEMNPAKVVFKVIKADPPRLERPHLWSTNFRDVVAKCLTKDPDNRPTAADVLAHPFFIPAGSVQCIRSLISEMNAEQVTTEVVMGSDDEVLYDDDDDDDTATVSSAATTSEIRLLDDVVSVSGKQQQHQQHQSVISVTDSKVPEIIKPVPEVSNQKTIGTVNAGTTTFVELSPAAEIDTTTAIGINLSMPITSGKKQRAPSLPESTGSDVKEEKSTVAVVEINGDKVGTGDGKSSPLGSSGSAGSDKSAGAGHRAAVEDALSDLDKVLNLEVPEEPPAMPTLSPSPGFLPSERSKPTVPLGPATAPSVSNKTEKKCDSKSRVRKSTSDGEVQAVLQKEKKTTGQAAVPATKQQEKPKSPEISHNIRDTVAEKQRQLHSQMVVQGRPTTVQITETGAIVTTSDDTSMDTKLAETNARAKFTRPDVTNEANFVYALKVADNQQLKIKVISKKDDNVAARNQKILDDHGPKQQPYFSKIHKKKDAVAYKSFDSLLKVDGEEFMSHAAATAVAGPTTAIQGAQRSSSQPQVNASSEDDGKEAIKGARSRHVIQVDDVAVVSATDTNHRSTDKRPLAASLSTDQITVHKYVPHSASQEAASRVQKNYVSENQNLYYYSVAKSASEKNSPVAAIKQLPQQQQQQQQSMRAEFKILPPPGTDAEAGMEMVQPGDRGAKKTIVEVRRPVSYPETSKKQRVVGDRPVGGTQKLNGPFKARSPPVTKSTRGASSPPLLPHSFSRHSAVVAARALEQNSNKIIEQDRNRKRLVSEPQEEERSRNSRNKNIIEQKKERSGNQNGAIPAPHHVIPTTSSRRREQQHQPTDQEYNYFETASSSSSNSSKNLQRQGYESGEHSSSFVAPLRGGEISPAVARVQPIPRAVLMAPPPEPPVDYYENGINSNSDRKALSNLQQPMSNNTIISTTTSKNVIGNGTKAPIWGTPSVGSRRSPHRQTVTKKTRVYVVDGVQMTSTSHQVFGVKQDYELRKQQLHELRRLQREEARQQRELNAKAEAQRNEQAKRFALDKENIYKKTDIELQALARTQKRQLKECEERHAEDMKQALRRIQNEQERELRMFHEQLKQEQRDLKTETDTLPKSQRKDSYRIRKEQLEKEQQKREMNFIADQQAEQAAKLARVQLEHKIRILQMEKDFQEQKHGVLRSREASEWDLEEKQLAERHALNKQELKDRFYLQRTQMYARHQRELDHMRRVNEMEEEEQIRLHANFKKRLPKDFRTESKTRIAMFKESLRISCQNEDPSTLNEKIRAFEEKEKQRVRNALEEHDSKYSRKLRNLKEKNATAIKELEEIHSEKRKMLLEAEQNKMDMYEKEYEQVIADWKSGLPIRKQALEAEFARELDEVEAFYRKENAHLQQLSAATTPTGSIASRQEIV